MNLLMYAIADGSAAEIEGKGLGGHPLRGIGDDALVAVVSDHDGPPPEPSDDALWAYEQVIELLMIDHAVLPARFGSVLGEESTARTMLRSRRDRLTRALDQVRGNVELAVRASWRHPGEAARSSAPETGLAYMLGRLELRRKAEMIASKLDPLGQLARAARHRVLPHPTMPLIGAYLVEQARVHEFAELVKRLDDQLEEVELVCTGPWPPYSFVEEAGA